MWSVIHSHSSQHMESDSSVHVYTSWRFGGLEVWGFVHSVMLFLVIELLSPSCGQSAPLSAKPRPGSVVVVKIPVGQQWNIKSCRSVMHGQHIQSHLNRPFNQTGAKIGWCIVIGWLAICISRLKVKKWLVNALKVCSFSSFAHVTETNVTGLLCMTQKERSPSLPQGFAFPLHTPSIGCLAAPERLHEMIPAGLGNIQSDEIIMAWRRVKIPCSSLFISIRALND